MIPNSIKTCPEELIQQLNRIEINYSSKVIEAEFWKSFHNKCSKKLHVLKLHNIIVSKQTHQSLIKFISGCKNLNEFQSHRWKFSNGMIYGLYIDYFM